MANARTQIPIPAGVWTLIINNATNARVSEKVSINSGYITLAYNDAGDDPNALEIPVSPNTETVEKMFFDANNDWFFSSSTAGYVWAAPVGDKAGILITTQ